MAIDLDRLHQHFPDPSPHRRSGRTYASCIIALQIKEDFCFVVKNKLHIDSAKKVLKSAAEDLGYVHNETPNSLTFFIDKAFNCFIITESKRLRGIDKRVFYDHFSL